MLGERTSNPSNGHSAAATERSKNGPAATLDASLPSSVHDGPFAIGPAEASVRDFIESSTVAMHSVSADGTILWANRAELDLVGYGPEEYVGHNITEFHADRPVIEEILARLTRGEILRAYPARLRRKDGSIRHVALDSSALFENGEFIHSRCVTRDLTAEVEVAHKLREADKWQRGLLDALPIAVYTTDAEGRITHYNEQEAAVAGRSA